MKRVMSPASGCREVEGLGGHTYKQQRDGSYRMTDRDAKALVKIGGFLPSEMGVTSSRLGFRCVKCGFGTWFKKCSRCGGKCVRDKA